MGADERLERFRARLAELVAFNDDRVLGEELEPEAMTVVDAIVEAIGDAPVPPIDGLELREALTLTSLLGRRAGLLDATVALALALAPAILHSVEIDVGRHLDSFRTVAIDGYVRAREERQIEIGGRRAADAIPAVELVRGCFVVFLRGLQEADELERVLDDLGRRLLDRDARALLVDAAGLRGPDRERAGQLFAVHATCVMLGVTCVYSGVGPQWRAVASERGTDLTDVRFADDLPHALDIVLDACDLEIRKPTRFRRVLERLVGR